MSDPPLSDNVESYNHLIAASHRSYIDGELWVELLLGDSQQKMLSFINLFNITIFNYYNNVK